MSGCAELARARGRLRDLLLLHQRGERGPADCATCCCCCSTGKAAAVRYGASTAVNHAVQPRPSPQSGSVGVSPPDMETPGPPPAIVVPPPARVHQAVPRRHLFGSVLHGRHRRRQVSRLEPQRQDRATMKAASPSRKATGVGDGSSRSRSSWSQSQHRRWWLGGGITTAGNRRIRPIGVRECGQLHRWAAAVTGFERRRKRWFLGK